MTEVGQHYQNLRDRLNELVADYKKLVDEFKDYRHDIRNQLHLIGLEVERIQVDRQVRGDDVAALKNMVNALVARVDVIERQRDTVRGGAFVVRWFWGGISVILAAGISWLIGHYG